ncbi:DnaJ (Hsp40), subfamily A, member 4 [Balamuthia mandrillaris]
MDAAGGGADGRDASYGGAAESLFKEHTEYYDRLEVTKDVTEEELKRKYHRLAIKYHPDRNPEGTETFQKIAQAYAVLKNADLREVYDAYGEEGVREYEAVKDRSFNVRGVFWVVLAWLIIYLLDYYFNTAFEWLLAVGCCLLIFDPVFLMWGTTSSALRFLLTIACYTLGDVLLYYLFSTERLVFFAILSIHAAMLCWLNAQRANWDLSLGLYIGWILIDTQLRTVPSGWSFLAAHTILYCGLITLIFIVGFISTPALSTRSYVVKPAINILLQNLVFMIWLPIWLLDKWIWFPLEWLLLDLSLVLWGLPLLGIISRMGPAGILLLLSAVLLPPLLSYLFIPAAYLPLLTTFFLHAAIAYLLLYLPTHSKLLRKRYSKQKKQTNENNNQNEKNEHEHEHEHENENEKEEEEGAEEEEAPVIFTNLHWSYATAVLVAGLDMFYRTSPAEDWPIFCNVTWVVVALLWLSLLLYDRLEMLRSDSIDEHRSRALYAAVAQQSTSSASSSSLSSPASASDTTSS